jgi:collagenase-like PrtC family protease
MKKRLYVPHPGHFDGLKELISAAGKDIYSVFMAGSPDYVGTGRSNLSSPQIEDIREQTEYAHKNGVAVEIVLNSSCLGGRQLTPAEKHVAQDEYSQITKQMRRRQCRADAIRRLGEDVQEMHYR